MIGRDFVYGEKNAITRHDVAYRYKLTDYPETLRKKVEQFNYVREKLCDNRELSPGSMSLYTLNYIQSQMVYVKKWIKLQNATLFRLSNKIIQIIFDDRTEILFDIDRKQVAYIGYSRKKAIYSTSDVSDILDSGNTEMIKRFNYAKEILRPIFSSSSKSHKRIIKQNIDHS